VENITTPDCRWAKGTSPLDADHQAMPVLIDDVGELLDVRRDLGLQRRRQHLPGPITDQLIQQRPRRLSRRLLRSFLSNYREHGRTHHPTTLFDPPRDER
jgi:hypothetical protein